MGFVAATKRTRRGDATRSELIRVATELFAQRGYEGTSIEAVLSASGASRGALYHHFSSKADLFEAVFASVEDYSAQKVRAAAARAREPVAALRAGCRTWVRLAADPVVQRVVLIDAPAVLGWRRWREMEETQALGQLKAALRASADRGELADDLVDTFAHALLASLNEIALLIAEAADTPKAVRAGERAVDELLARLIRP
jgi:AcrR family transcriptional regulator